MTTRSQSPPQVGSATADSVSQARLHTDVLIVGFGAAGASAALEARQAGADVLVLDRFNGGGATAISGGIIYAGGGTAVQRAAGVEDTYDGMLAYLRHEVGDAVRDETLQRFAASTPAMIDWLIGHGVPFDATVCPYKTSYPNNRYYLYYSGSECSGEASALTPPVQRGHRIKGKGASGKKLFDPLADAAARAGARVQLHTRVTRVIMTGGRAAGVEAVTLADAPARIRQRYRRLAAVAAKPGIYYPPLRRLAERLLQRLEGSYGRTITIEAAAGVIVCAGGYIENREMVATHAPRFRHGLPLGTTGDDGSGIAMTVEAGGVADQLDNVSAWRFITPPSALYGGVVVNQDGRRVIDETCYGASVGRVLVREHDGRGWLLADAATMREAYRQLPRQSQWFHFVQSLALFSLKATRGTTLAEVARRAGVDPGGLAATVAAHNDAADSGRPDPAGKPAEFVRRVGDGPYVLLDISVRTSAMYPCPMFTLGGVLVDEGTGAVTDADGRAIPGLYAAGRTAIGMCSNSYVSGLSLSDCVFSGRRAGAHVAAQARRPGG